MSDTPDSDAWSSVEAATARAYIGAALYGPFLLDSDVHALDWEFQTLTGFAWADAKRIAAEWDGRREPEGRLRDVLRTLAFNLVGYPHGRMAELEALRELSAARRERLRTVLRVDDTKL